MVHWLDGDIYAGGVRNIGVEDAEGKEWGLSGWEEGFMGCGRSLQICLLPLSLLAAAISVRRQRLEIRTYVRCA